MIFLILRYLLLDDNIYRFTILSFCQCVSPIHNKIEDFLKEALRSESILFNLQIQPKMLTELNEWAVMFLQDELKKRTENLAIENWYQDERITNGLLDLVHHLFWLDEDRGWAEAVPRFVEAWIYDYRWAESLLEVITAFSGRLCALGQKRLKIFQAEFKTGSSEKETQTVLDELNKIAKQTDWLTGAGKGEREIIIERKTGWIKYYQSNYEEALAIFLDIQSNLSRKWILLKTILGNDFKRIALSLFLQETFNYELVIFCYKQALAINPEDHESWFNNGLALHNSGKIQEAIASYREAIRIKPSKHEAWNNLAYALYQLGNLEDSISSCDEAIRIVPDFKEAWYNKANALSDLGRYKDAVASYRKSLGIR